MDADYADEQMIFGFSAGDRAIATPYLYLSLYPEPAGWHGGPLPSGSSWTEKGFRGELLPYAKLVRVDDALAIATKFLGATHIAGRKQTAAVG